MDTTKVITWKTTKNTDGTYSAIVYSFGHQVPAVTLGTYARKTRAQAVGVAKKATRYFKSIQA